MNCEEIEDHLSSLVLELDTNRIKLNQLKQLDKQIAENEKQLKKSLIKIPFFHKTILDNLGIIKHHVPTLLEQNKQLVTRYNAKLQRTQQLEESIRSHFIAIGDDLKNSNSEEKAAKMKVIRNYFPSLNDMGVVNHD